MYMNSYKSRNNFEVFNDEIHKTIETFLSLIFKECSKMRFLLFFLYCKSFKLLLSSRVVLKVSPLKI